MPTYLYARLAHWIPQYLPTAEGGKRVKASSKAASHDVESDLADMAMLALAGDIPITPYNISQKLRMCRNSDSYGSTEANLAALGSTYVKIHDLYRQSEDLEVAIDCYVRLVEIVGDEHHDKPSYLNTLGILLQDKFEVCGQSSCLDKALQYTTHAESLSVCRKHADI